MTESQQKRVNCILACIPNWEKIPRISEVLENELDEAFDEGYEAGECIDEKAKLQQFHDTLSSLLTNYENGEAGLKCTELYNSLVELQSETSRIIN